MNFPKKHFFIFSLWCFVLLWMPLNAQSLYWLDASFYTPTIGKSAADGSNIQTTALNAFSLPEALTYSYPDKKILWTELQFSGASIHGIDTSFTTDSPFLTNISTVRGIAFDVDSNWIYYATTNLQTGPKINRVHPDGSGNETVLALDGTTGNPRALAIDASARELYWTEFTQGSINRIDLDNVATPQTIVNGLSGPVGLAIDHAAGKLYWSEANANTISRSNLDGSSKSIILSNLATPNYLTIDTLGSVMYWTEVGTPRIRKATMSGTSVETLPIIVSHPTGIRFVPQEETALSVEISTFTAVAKGNSVELAWQTASEVNNYGFEIQRSPSPTPSQREGASETPLREVWGAVGFVEGLGNSNAPKEYSFTEKKVADGKYEYRLKLVNLDGSFSYSQSINAEVKFIPAVFALSQNYPNPFNPTTNIQYSIPNAQFVTLKVYDMLGREVATLVNGMQEAGSYNLRFDAKSLASGIYFYRIQAADFVSIKKMLLIK